MKIRNYLKDKNGFYKIRLEDDQVFSIHENLILKYDLLLIKEVNIDLLNEILQENKTYIVYNQALKYLKKKTRSIYEMENILRKDGFNDDLIANVIKLLKEQGYLNDLVFCQCYINDQLLLTNYGKKQIKNALINKNVSDDSITKALDEIDDNVWIERINKIITKKVKGNHNKGKMYLIQKIKSDLITLGYDLSLINQVLLKTSIVVDKKVYETEYQKIYNKLSKKYSGAKLDFLVKQNMYKNGFGDRNEEILD